MTVPTKAKRTTKRLAVTDAGNAVLLMIPSGTDFEHWVDLGQNLIAQRRQADWMIADWFRYGRENFAGNEQFTMLLEQMGVDQKQAASDAKVAALIPEGWRSDKVSFEVAREIAKVDDVDRRRTMLAQAEREHWTSKRAHQHVTEYRFETGDLYDDDDATPRLATELFRLWNRMTPSVREYAFPLIEVAAGDGYKPIDEDQPA